MSDPIPSPADALIPVAADIPSLPPDDPSGDRSTLNAPTLPGSGGTRAILLGKFRLLALLGEGGMGKVIRAEDTSLKRQVALKCLKKSDAGKAYKPDQFLREARAAAALEHPHIVQIYETGEAAGYFYIAMELVEGGHLGSLIKACGPLDVVRACQLCAEAAEALAFAAQHGVTHRDVKPGNLMLSRSGRCKVTDFGLAHISDPGDSFAMPKGAVGTPAYIAPELLNGLPATPKSDVYSLACTLFYLLTGKTPFTAKDKPTLLRMHIDMPAPDIKNFRPDLPDSLAKVIARALSKNPDDRPGPDTFAKQLRAHTIPVGASQSMSMTSTGPFVPAPPTGGGVAQQQLDYATPAHAKKRMLLIIGCVAAGLLVIILGVFLLFFSESYVKSSPMPVAVHRGGIATPVTVAPPPDQIAVAPVPEAAPNPAAAPRPRRPATPAPADSSATLKASDLDALKAAAQANATVTITGTIATYDISTDGDHQALITFADAPNFTLIIPARLFAPMTKTFGGHDGDGAKGQAIHVTGAPVAAGEKVTLTLSSTKSIEAAH